MPTMVRPEGKPRKIVYAILGKPGNLANKPTEREKRINKRLWFEETQRAR